MTINILEEHDNRLAELLSKGVSEYDEGDIQVQKIESFLCRQSFLRFLRHCKLIIPPRPNERNSGGLVPFEVWGHTKEMVGALLSHRLVVMLKSRQIGASWLCAAYDLWFALFHRGAVVLLYSKGELEAAEKLDKCRKIYTHLPTFLKPTLNPDTAMSLGFPAMNSKLLAMPSTPTAGISFTASIIDCDEWEEHPYASEHYNAAKPVIDAGGQFIGTFTINKTRATSLARNIYTSARSKDNSFFPLFFPYNVMPGRDEKWYEARASELTSDELGGVTPELYMQGNYPRSEQEALSHSQSIAAFNIDSLTWMMGQVRNPIELPDVDNKIVHIYKPHSIGNFYIASTDTSHGVGKDFSVTLVLNVKTGEVVADILHNHLSEEELASQSVKMLGLYGNPLWCIEDNDWGRSVILAAQRLGYRNLYSDKDKPGFHTGVGDEGRTALWGSLIPAINNKQIIIYNKNGINQFFDVIRNAEKGGRIEAQQGRHDDYPMALAIAWYKKGEVQTDIYSSKPISTLHFGNNIRVWR